MVLFYKDEIKGILEALLFVADEPLTCQKISQVMGIEEHTIQQFIEDLQKDYDQPHRGLLVEEVAGGYRMVTKPQHIAYIEKLYKPQINPLSQAALETLAIIAYRQPITKAEIEIIRGVSVDSVMTTLAQRELIVEVGRKEGPGRPIMYGTTKRFMEHLGLKSIQDLPFIDGLKEK
ncbi:MAG: SMC-Scp complex subunit ScpB [Bacillota bacterium]